MTKQELLHFTSNNSYTSLSVIHALGDSRLVMMRKPAMTLYFHNGHKVSEHRYNAVKASYRPFKTVINYDQEGNHVRLTYYDDTLEEIHREYLNKDNVYVTEDLKYMEIGE